MSKDLIKDIQAREILDSRGNPTVEVDVLLDSGIVGRGSVPSGASTGSREALELRDGDKSRYLGKGVQKAVLHIHEEIRPALVGMDPSDLRSVDQKMITLDGTESKSKLGANAILGVSMATCRAAAETSKLQLFEFLRDIYYGEFCSTTRHEKGVTLPTPMMNIVNGGEHADNNISIQEFMIFPSCGGTFRESLRCGVEVFHHLKKVLQQDNHSTNVGDEGGFAPNFQSNEEAFSKICDAISNAGYRLGQDVQLAIDAAASEFHSEKDGYNMNGAPSPKMNCEELIEYYGNLVEKYPLVSIEDGLAEADWDGWDKLTAKIGKKTMLVGDDLFVTNAKILQEGIDKKVANAILIKLNQIGSVSETLETIALAHKNHYNTVISHRSGETEDSFLADLAVATDAGLVKTGSASRGERMAKYNQLLRIEERLGTKANFWGNQSIGRKL